MTTKNIRSKLHYFKRWGAWGAKPEPVEEGLLFNQLEALGKGLKKAAVAMETIAREKMNDPSLDISGFETDLFDDFDRRREELKSAIDGTTPKLRIAASNE